VSGDKCPITGGVDGSDGPTLAGYRLQPRAGQREARLGVLITENYITYMQISEITLTRSLCCTF